MREIIILDASAIINGYNPLLVDKKEQVISVDTLNEILEKEKRKMVEDALEINRLKKVTPKEEFVKKVEEIAKETNDKKYLSKSDVSTIALALEMKEKGFDPIIVTDDFSIQNVVKFLGLKYASVATRGIRKVIKWKLYCPACGKVYYEEVNECLICGSKLKRKPRS